MNKDAIINRIAYQTGCSRKEVLDTLKAFGMLPGANKQTNKGSYGT
jgi:hypothetical protein